MSHSPSAPSSSRSNVSSPSSHDSNSYSHKAGLGHDEEDTTRGDNPFADGDDISFRQARNQARMNGGLGNSDGWSMLYRKIKIGMLTLGRTT